MRMPIRPQLHAPCSPLKLASTPRMQHHAAPSDRQEIVVGALVAAPRGWRPRGERTPEAFKSLLASQQPGFALAAMNFRLEGCDAHANQAAAPCTVLTTETRVYATDAASRRAFRSAGNCCGRAGGGAARVATAR